VKIQIVDEIPAQIYFGGRPCLYTPMYDAFNNLQDGEVMAVEFDTPKERHSARSSMYQYAAKRGIPIKLTYRENTLYIRRKE